MNGKMIDIAIVGGGLAGGLIALAVHRRHPDMRLALIEAGETLGGNHRWSWFETDLDQAGERLLGGFRTVAWDRGTQVHFPAYSRSLEAGYRSLASDDYDAALRRELPASAIVTGRAARQLAPDAVILQDGETIPARTVIDCRNFEPTAHLAGGWQVFMGRHMRLSKAHGLTQPIIMDARVRQHDAYRFVYTLPVGGHELFVEDTYYADAPVLDRSALSRRIDAYCRAQGWNGEIAGGETGVLPVITHGDARRHRAQMAPEGIVLAGARGLFTHPLTSYTVPIAVENALAIARDATLSGPQLAALVDARARAHWRRTRFYRRLGRMLFDAARPDQRYRVFEHFYRKAEPLIERFYNAHSTTADKLRVLTGRPPVPVHRAIPALLGKGTPLVQGQD